MASEEAKRWFNREADRLQNYRHQHRGLNFLKLLLPPAADRKVNLVGLDNHIYRGSIPKHREDQLPPYVDEKSIDEEALYKEIKDMHFPPVPPQEPLGPRRRIGGAYTLARKMTLAPVKIDYDEGMEEIQVLGKDGGIYRGRAKYPSKVELDRQLRGTKRPIKKVRQQSSSRGFIEPSFVSLHRGGQSAPFGRRQKSFVELPAANVGKIIELILIQNKKTRGKGSITKDEMQSQITEKEDSSSEQTEELKDVQPTDESKGSEESEELNEEESEDIEYIEEQGESEDTDYKEESEDAEHKEAEDAEYKEESEDAEHKEESEDAEHKEAEDTEHKEAEDAEYKEKSEDAERKEAEDAEHKEESDDAEHKETDENAEREEYESTNTE